MNPAKKKVERNIGQAFKRFDFSRPRGDYFSNVSVWGAAGGFETLTLFRTPITFDNAFCTGLIYIQYIVLKVI